MRRIITIYVLVVVLLSLGIFGIGAMASAQELRDPMQPPPFALQKFRQAKWANQPRVDKAKTAKPKPKRLQLTSILYSKNRKIAIIDDQMLAVGDRVRGAKLVKLTRYTARLVRSGKVINLNLGNDLPVVRKKVAESDL